MRYRKRYIKEEKSPERIELEKLIREHVRLSKRKTIKGGIR